MTLSQFIYQTLQEVLQEEDQKTPKMIRKMDNKFIPKSPQTNTKKKKRVISEQMVREACKNGQELVIEEGDIITPLAKDALVAYKKSKQ